MDQQDTWDKTHNQLISNPPKYWRPPPATLLWPVSGVELGQCGGWDTLQHLLGEDTQQLPANVQGFKDGAFHVRALRDEGLLKLGQELQVEQVISCESLFTHHGLHGLQILGNGIASIQLVGHVGVVLAGHALADGRLHESGEGRQHVDGRVDLTVVQLTLNVDLSLSDVASEIRDGMSDICEGTTHKYVNLHA